MKKRLEGQLIANVLNQNKTTNQTPEDEDAVVYRTHTCVVLHFKPPAIVFQIGWAHVWEDLRWLCMHLKHNSFHLSYFYFGTGF